MNQNHDALPLDSFDGLGDRAAKIEAEQGVEEAYGYLKSFEHLFESYGPLYSYLGNLASLDR